MQLIPLILFQENELVQLGATHFYVQYGSSSSQDSAKNVVQECINNSLLAAKSEEKWLQMISSAHHQVNLHLFWYTYQIYYYIIFNIIL